MYDCLVQHASLTYKFTSKERDPESGLDNFGARYDSSQFGRFMSPDDPFVGWDQYDPQSLNAYAYVRNNPLNMVDDDGHQALPGGSCTSLWCLLSNVFHTIFGGGGGHEDVTTHMITNNPDFSSPANNGMLGQKIPGQNNLTLQDFSIGSQHAMVDGFKFTTDTTINCGLVYISGGRH
jgi:RHS repeat-associated protein